MSAFPQAAGDPPPPPINDGGAAQPAPAPSGPSALEAVLPVAQFAQMLQAGLVVPGRGLRGAEPDDWYIPEEGELPSSSDPGAAVPGSEHERWMVAPPELPPGSSYSPSINMYRSPAGELIDAGEFRPLPRDKMSIDPSDLPDPDFNLPSGPGRELPDGV